MSLEEQIEGSIRPGGQYAGCSDNWLEGILRSSEFEIIDVVVGEQENRLTQLNQWRFLKPHFPASHEAVDVPGEKPLEAR